MSSVSELTRLFDCWREGHSFEDFYADISNALEDTGSELRRLLKIAYDQQTELYGLRLQVLHLTHNNEVLTNALWKACGDDEQVVTDTIESQGTLR
jgi:hypothetical protein